jgi:hypothetical protein
MGILALYAGLFDERIKQVLLNEAPGSHWQGPALLKISGSVDNNFILLCLTSSF